MLRFNRRDNVRTNNRAVGLLWVPCLVWTALACSRQESGEAKLQAQLAEAQARVQELQNRVPPSANAPAQTSTPTPAGLALARQTGVAPVSPPRRPAPTLVGAPERAANEPLTEEAIRQADSAGAENALRVLEQAAARSGETPVPNEAPKSGEIVTPSPPVPVPVAQPTEPTVEPSVAVGSGSEIGGTGEFDASIVVSQIRSRLKAIQACYEQELRAHLTLAGKVTTEFTIEERGNVVNVKITGNTMGEDRVAQCVASTVARFRFNPGPEGGAVTFSYPFVFAPK